jgi:hypothetical protein
MTWKEIVQSDVNDVVLAPGAFGTEQAVYTPSAGDPSVVTAMLIEAESVVNLQTGEAVTAGTEICGSRSALPSLARGDRLTIGGATYVAKEPGRYSQDGIVRAAVRREVM